MEKTANGKISKGFKSNRRRADKCGKQRRVRNERRADGRE
jgi:hypothetical protein